MPTRINSVACCAEKGFRKRNELQARVTGRCTRIDTYKYMGEGRKIITDGGRHTYRHGNGHANAHEHAEEDEV